MMRAKRFVETIATTIVACVITVHDRAGVAVAAPRPPTVRLENGFLVNSRVPYFFALPDGWVLKNAADYRAVEVQHAESGAVFNIAVERAQIDPNMFYTALYMSLTSLAVPGTQITGGDASVGGRPAREVHGMVNKKDQGKVQFRAWLVADGEVMYRITSSVPEAAVEARGPDVTRMIGSFQWSRPPKAS
jgi:hypothetical protein